MKIIVFAGGSGSRLWPLSQPSYPKPLLRLGKELSFLQKTLLRFLRSYGSSSLAIVAHEQYRDPIRLQCLEICPEYNIPIIEEKYSQSTAVAAALGIAFLQENGSLSEDEPILLSPSDGRIFPLDNFLEEISLAEEVVREGDMVLLGVVPTSLELGYGYIECEPGEERFAKKKRFIEKPSLELAKQLMQEKEILWNTGHVLVTARTFWKEAEKYFPEIISIRDMPYIEAVEKAKDIPAISLDYALLEPSDKVKVGKLQALWSDMGTWDRIYQVMPKDNQGNVILGKSINIESNECLLVAEGVNLITIGLEGLIVIATEKGVLIAKQGSGELVKQAFSCLEENANKDITCSV